MTEKPSISVVIIAYNEAANIGRAVKSAFQISADVIVVDSFSKDNTAAIAAENGARVLQQLWLGYGPQRNSGIEAAVNDWIFCLDADEEISAALAESIAAADLQNINMIYECKRRNNFCGKWIKYGLWGRDKVQRFFNRKKVLWDDSAVHENLKSEGVVAVKMLQGFLLHYSYNNEQELFRRSERYAELGSQELLKQKIKPGFFRKNINPIHKFIVNYFFRLGFLDGREGWIIAVNLYRETRLKYLKLQNLLNQTNHK
jgi:glycosyltransferase involved in cell wall biosynthesis